MSDDWVEWYRKALRLSPPLPPIRFGIHDKVPTIEEQMKKYEAERQQEAGYQFHRKRWNGVK
jgi:hypothetical protein